MGATEACRISRCEDAAHWIVESHGHPNGDFKAAYCGSHAEQKVGSLWSGSPKPYTMSARGPFNDVRPELAA
jgi:hypothetical protein